MAARAPWEVSDELWELVEPLIPRKERRFRYPARRRLPDREALCRILFVLHTGIAASYARWASGPVIIRRQGGHGSGLEASAGSSSAPSRTSATSNDCSSATSAAPTCTRPRSPSAAASSATADSARSFRNEF
jgi:Putative transposase of IS4/5 family (DUF4096)